MRVRCTGVVGGRLSHLYHARLACGEMQIQHAPVLRSLGLYLFNVVVSDMGSL